MVLSRLASTLIALLPGVALAQAQPMPQGLVARGVALAAICRAAGGQAVNGPRPFMVNQYDLTGDGRPEFIMDAAAFACSSRAFNVGGPAGAPFEVFDGATGQSLFRGVVAGWQPMAGARPQLMLTFRGPVCSPNAMATTTCQRPLAWNAQTRTLAHPPLPGAPAAAARPAAGAPPPAPAAPPAQAASAPPAGSMTLSEADKAAALRAAGFKQVGRQWKRCEEDTPTASYQPGSVEEVVDLNRDGRPEAVVTESSSFCHGQEGAWFAILTREANGGWRQVLETDGVFVAMPSMANGWQEVMVGGPGFTHPAYRYNGREYVQNRMVRE